MVDDPDEFALVRNAGTQKFIVHINSEVGCSVVAHQIIESDGVDLTGMHGFGAGCPGDDLFGYCHSHSGFLHVKI